MPTPRLREWLGLFCVAAIALVPAQTAEGAKPQHARARPIQLAVTFDDLPVHANLPPGVSRTDVAKSIIQTLKARHAPPVYGFVNAVRLTKEPGTAEVLRLWRAAGNPLGNHTLTHMDADTNPVEAFEQEIVADEPALRKYMGRADWHWLRLPYLHAGDTAEKRRQIEAFAKARGYRPALVTLSFDDYAFNDAYARCMAKSDKDAVEWMKQTFLDRASVDILAAQAMSKTLYRRNIKHVLLMHIGAFDAVMLPKLLDMYKQRGVRLISLPEAESDPAYEDRGNRQFDWGGTMLAEQMAARNIPLPEFANRDDDLKQLASLCK
jgi:peptidoglycan/xylan/chitin deacetylase (PgdA/CDA1 family)